MRLEKLPHGLGLLLALVAEGPFFVVLDTVLAQGQGVRVTNQVQVHESNVLSGSEDCAVPPSYEANGAANSFDPVSAGRAVSIMNGVSLGERHVAARL